MKLQLGRRFDLGVSLLLVFSVPVAAHSWIERALKIEPITRQFFGDEGFPRGYIPRTDPAFNDEEYIWRLPYTGTGFYTGDETINKHPIEHNPSHAMLEAAPGDFIAILHFENGHTTVPESSPDKPLNRGTIFLYGTDEPRDEEKLFDVHLAWNQDGTGGDKRGRLLATRNYDDGQCYEARGEGLALERATTLGVDPMTPLACQSDLQLPDDLEPGTVYTIYWYWDWPNLNKEEIDMEATDNGLFPWAGTFMRGEADPNGFTMNAIATNESYASTIDIKIVDKEVETASKAQVGTRVSSDSNEGSVFNLAIKEQLESNFGVPIADGEGSNPPVESSPATSPVSPVPTAPAPSDTISAPVQGPETVTVTVTQPPTTVATTIYVTQLPETQLPEDTQLPETPPPETQIPDTPIVSPSPSKTACSSDPVHVITAIETQYTTVYPEGTPSAEGDSGLVSSETTVVYASTTLNTLSRPPAPTTTPRWGNQTEGYTPQPHRVKRTNWWFGHN